MSNAGPFSSDQSDSASTLREALRALGPGGAGAGSLGNLTPQQLAELAQRAGLPGGMADLARITGLDLAGRGDFSGGVCWTAIRRVGCRRAGGVRAGGDGPDGGAPRRCDARAQHS